MHLSNLEMQMNEFRSMAPSTMCDKTGCNRYRVTPEFKLQPVKCSDDVISRQSS
jgi:hypothetical protein